MKIHRDIQEKKEEKIIYPLIIENIWERILSSDQGRDGNGKESVKNGVKNQ